MIRTHREKKEETILIFFGQQDVQPYGSGQRTVLQFNVQLHGVFPAFVYSLLPYNQKWLKLMVCLFTRAALLLVQKTQLKYF